MEHTRAGWERWLGAAGVAYVVVHRFILSLGADPGAGIRATQSTFTHAAGQQNVTAGLFQAAGLLILLFALGVRAHLRGAEGEPKSLSSLILGAAFASAVLAFVGSALTFALEAKVAALGDASLTYSLFQVWWAILIGYLVMVGIVALAASALALITRGFPHWIGWLGIVCGLALAGACLAFYPTGGVIEGPVDGVAYIGELLFDVWAIAAGVVVLRGGRTTRTAEAGELRAEAAPAR